MIATFQAADGCSAAAPLSSMTRMRSLSSLMRIPLGFRRTRSWGFRERWRARSVGGLAPRRDERQPDDEDRALPGLRLEPEPPAQGAGDEIIDDVQAETRAAAAAAGGEERLEGTPLHVLAHADAVVGELDFDLLGPD